MKIGLIVPGFSADDHDWCIPAHTNLARSLASAHQIHVIALRYPHRRDVYNIQGVTVHSLGGATRQGLASTGLWMTALDVVRREHRASRFDILHSIFGGEAGLVTIVASRLLGIPGVVSLVGGELVGLKEIGYGQELLWRQRLMNRIALRTADLVLCGTKRITVLARSLLPTGENERVQTLPLGVDTRMFAPFLVSENGSAESAKRFFHSRERTRAGSANILNVGSLIPVKDQATLLAAAAGFMRAKPQARLRIVGTGKLECQLRALATTLKIDERVDFVGAVPHDRLPEVYRWADLFVQSSRHEGQGMVVLEAAASGVPTAGTDVGVLSDLASEGAGIAVPPADAGALTDAMHSALASRQRIGARSREVVESQYELQGIRERLEQLYLSLQNG